MKLLPSKLYPLASSLVHTLLYSIRNQCLSLKTNSQVQNKKLHYYGYCFSSCQQCMVNEDSILLLYEILISEVKPCSYYCKLYISKIVHNHICATSEILLHFLLFFDFESNLQVCKIELASTKFKLKHTKSVTCYLVSYIIEKEIQYFIYVVSIW